MSSRPASLVGAYDATRAAALAGVPKNTVYHWARVGDLVPSVSAVREKLWSFADVVQLRMIYWLRHPELDADAARARVSMAAIRRAKERLATEGLELWQRIEGGDGYSPLIVSRSGELFLDSNAPEELSGQTTLGADFLDVLGPFTLTEHAGPHLVRPRPSLRIIPGRVAGQPHLKGSRLTTLAVAAMFDRGYSLDDIAHLYPDEDRGGIAEAVDLELQLGSVTRTAA